MECETNQRKEKTLKAKLSEYLKRNKAIARPLAVTIKRVTEIGSTTEETTEVETTTEVTTEIESTTEVTTEIPTESKATIVDKASNATYQITQAGTAEYVKPINTNYKSVVIPSEITANGKVYKVTSIAPNAFKNNKKLTKVVIGKNIKTIGANAFYGCKKLKTVSIGTNVTIIGNKAFYKCTAMTKITISAKVTKIGSKAFYGCKKLKTITIKTKKLKSKNVGKQAFKGIYSKATVKVPKTKYKAYKKMLKNKGVSSKAKYKKLK